jgi:hypothetical protein
MNPASGSFKSAGETKCAHCGDAAYMFRRKYDGVLKPLCPKHLQQGVEWLIDHNPRGFCADNYVPVRDGLDEWVVQAVMLS